MAESFKEHAQSKNVVLGGDGKIEIFVPSNRNDRYVVRKWQTVSPVGRGS